MYLHTRADGWLFKVVHPHANTLLVCDMLLADDAALATHSEAALQRLINKFASACGTLASQSVSRKPM